MNRDGSMHNGEQESEMKQDAGALSTRSSSLFSALQSTESHEAIF
jgi:hypothetical protein